jgi:hypothetical protein
LPLLAIADSSPGYFEQGDCPAALARADILVARCAGCHHSDFDMPPPLATLLVTDH